MKYDYEIKESEGYDDPRYFSNFSVPVEIGRIDSRHVRVGDFDLKVSPEGHVKTYRDTYWFTKLWLCVHDFDLQAGDEEPANGEVYEHIGYVVAKSNHDLQDVKYVIKEYTHYLRGEVYDVKFYEVGDPYELDTLVDSIEGIYGLEKAKTLAEERIKELENER